MAKKNKENKQAKAAATSTSPSSSTEENVTTQSLKGEMLSPMDDISNRLQEQREGLLSMHALMNVNYVLEDICEKYIKKEHSKIRDALQDKINNQPSEELRDLWRSSILDAIKDTHQYKKMSLKKNCDFEKIPTDPWQLAKACMMSGSQKCTSVQETDVSGLLAVFLNAKVFDIFGPEVMKAAKCVREARNDIIHTSKLKITEENRQKYMNKMIAFLKSIKAKISNSDLPLEGDLGLLQGEINNLVKLKKIKDFAELLTDENKKTEFQKFTDRELYLALQRSEADLNEKILKNSEEVEGIKKDQQNVREMRETFETFELFVRDELQKLHENVSDKRSIPSIINEEATKDVSHPPELTESHFDIALAFVEADEGAAKKVIEILEKFVCFGDNQSPKICPLNEYKISLNWIQSHPKFTNEALKRSTFLFIIITDNFLGDKWADQLIDDAVTTDKNRPNRLVPVFLSSRSDVKEDLPYGLRHLRGLEVERFFNEKAESIKNFHRKDFVQEDFCQDYLNSVSEMLAREVHEREEREEKQERKYREWKQNNEPMTQQIEEMPTVDESIAIPIPESDSCPPSTSVQIDSGEQQLTNEK
ncbi:hypothetical protein CAPTEDRAFT_206648 [Capitella teleta]|uniref:TIR domain-containing protein n=1 Tax=Capitella teleta TaxID=283909 RepID=R7TQE2_CAPTE|nr:hypothetical protein CAPTEDRAFT_206648 [Capitella teleta]|eukprot:ELT95854.1 hypothetical protein CAPTEDRAFT_206648 [Capitella teleta]